MTANYKISQYIMLIEDFLRNKISARQFEQIYLHMFKSDITFRTGKEFEILDKLFSDVDSFCDDPSLITDSRFDIDESQLRVNVQKALLELKKLEKG